MTDALAKVGIIVFVVQLMISEHLDGNTVSCTELPLGNSYMAIPVLQMGKLTPDVLCLRSHSKPVALEQWHPEREQLLLVLLQQQRFQ